MVAQEIVQQHTERVLGFVPIRTTSTMGHQSFASTVTVPSLSGASLRSVEVLTQPDELTPDHPVPIMGVFEGRGTETISSNQTIAQKAAQVEWALVVKLELR